MCAFLVYPTPSAHQPVLGHLRSESPSTHQPSSTISDWVQAAHPQLQANSMVLAPKCFEFMMEHAVTSYSLGEMSADCCKGGGSAAYHMQCCTLNA